MPIHKIRRFRDLGIARTVVWLEPEKEDRSLLILDHWAELIRRC